MFYRIKTCVGVRKRIPFELHNPSAGNKIPHLMEWREFENLFEEIPTDSRCLGYRLFRAPIMPEYRINEEFAVTKPVIGEFPDVWTVGGTALVSERLRKVIEEVDDFKHQFWPVKIKTQNGEEISCQPYYWLNIRRFVLIEPHDYKLQNFPFTPELEEQRFLPRVLQDAELRSQIENLPVWRYYKQRQILYMNQDMISHLRQANVTGLDEYSDYYGRGEEALVHV